jgi:hypothetical protein
MNSWKMKCGLCLWILAGCIMAGCAAFVAGGIAVGAGVGAAEYIQGELKQPYAASMEKAWEASLAAAQSLNMKVAEKSIDNTDSKRTIKGKTEEGKDFQIVLEAMSPEVTMVKVRIGIFGDEAYSQKIQAAIAQKLKK